MRSAYLQPSSDSDRSPARRRTIAMLLALAAHILIVILLLRLTPTPAPLPAPDRPATFQLLPDTVHAPTPAPRGKTVVKVKRPSGGASPRRPAPRTPAPAPPGPIVLPPSIMKLDTRQFAASDVGKLPSHPDAAAPDSGDGEGTGKDSGSAYGPGEGPGGERLYNAEWYREPTDAELSGFLPPNGAPPGGYALIACKTVADYRVENCRSLSESPLGSGLANAMRKAAWQFRVRPPRVGGKKLVGAWVRIRIDFTRTARDPAGG